jgi:hypothetical protein
MMDAMSPTNHNQQEPSVEHQALTRSLADQDRRWNNAHRLLEQERLSALIVYGDWADAFPASLSPDAYATSERPRSIVVFPARGAPVSIAFLATAITDTMSGTYFYDRESHILVATYQGRTRPEDDEPMGPARGADGDGGAGVAHVIDLSHWKASTVPSEDEMATFTALSVAFGAGHGHSSTTVISTRFPLRNAAPALNIAASPIHVATSWDEATDFLHRHFRPIGNSG